MIIFCYSFRQITFKRVKIDPDELLHDFVETFEVIYVHLNYCICIRHQKLFYNYIFFIDKILRYEKYKLLVIRGMSEIC